MNETFSLQPQPKERMPKSEVLTKLQDQDDKLLKAISQQKLMAHTTMRSAEHMKKKLRVYVQSEQSQQGISNEDPLGTRP